MLTDGLRDVRIGLRLLRKSPGFTAVAVLTLALGIAATTAIYSVIYTTFFEPLPYRDADRLVMVWSDFKGDREMPAPWEFVEWKAQATVFDELEAWGGSEMYLGLGDRPERIQVGAATPRWLPMFGYGQPLALGRNFLPDDGTAGRDRVVIVSHRFWRERLGADPGVVGRSIQLDREPYTVVGVLAAGPADENVPVWMPLAFSGLLPVRDYDWGLYVMGRLKPGVTIEQANAGIQPLSTRLARVHRGEEGWTASVEPFRNNFVPDSTEQGLWLLFGAVAFLLLIACANVANLLLARGTARQRELAIRRSIGASRWAIVRQLIVESVLLAVIGGSIGAALAAGLLTAIVALMPQGMLPTETDIRLNLPVLLFTLGASIATGVLAGAAPAWHAARTNASDVLKDGGGRTTGARSRLRQTIVVLEFALAMALVSGGGLAAHSLYQLAHRDLGFRARGVLTMSVEIANPQARFAHRLQGAGGETSFDELIGLYRQALERVQALPGVSSASLSNSVPLLGQGGIEARVAGKPDTARELSGFTIVTPEYFETLGIRMARGRPFSEQDRDGAPPVAIVNEAFVRRHLADVDPLRSRLFLPQWKPSEWQIVGVHEDVRSWGAGLEPYPAVVLPLWQSRGRIPPGRLAVRTAGDPSALQPGIVAAVHAVDRDLLIGDVMTMEHVVSREFVGDRFNTVLFGGLALAGLLLAAIGIYGVSSFAVAQRTHEIGIRLALGADRLRIVRHVMREGLISAAAGTILGIGGAVAVARMMRGVVWGVTGMPAGALLAVSAVLLLTALAACVLPARRAASVDPMVALREE